MRIEIPKNLANKGLEMGLYDAALERGRPGIELTMVLLGEVHIYFGCV